MVKASVVNFTPFIGGFSKPNVECCVNFRPSRPELWSLDMAKASGSSCGSGEDQAERNRRIGPLWTPSSPGMPSHHRAGADGTERHCVRCGGVLCLILPKIRLPLFLREIGYCGNRGARARRRSRTL